MRVLPDQPAYRATQASLDPAEPLLVIRVRPVLPDLQDRPARPDLPGQPEPQDCQESATPVLLASQEPQEPLEQHQETLGLLVSLVPLATQESLEPRVRSGNRASSDQPEPQESATPGPLAPPEQHQATLGPQAQPDPLALRETRVSLATLASEPLDQQETLAWSDPPAPAEPPQEIPATPEPPAT